MKKSLLAFLLCWQLLQNIPSSAQGQGASKDYPAPEKSRLHFSLLSGYQTENYRWSIAGNTLGTNPNIYSELIWKNLAGPLAGIEAEWNCWKSFSIRSAYSRLFIVSGSVTDMDYQGDDRTNRVYYGSFDSDKGASSSWRTTLEYKIEDGPSFSLIPGLGYALHTQSLFLLSDATVGNNTLHSAYATTYKGATLTIRSIIALANFFSLEPSFCYDQVHFRGSADWNLITTFQHPLSFEDIANGYNIEACLKGNYSCNDHCSLFLSANYLYGNTGKGTDRLYQSNGQEPLTQFNGAIRHFGGIRAGLKLNISCIGNEQF